MTERTARGSGPSRRPTREDRRPRARGPVRTTPPAPLPGEDSVDRHVRRWRTWEALDLDEDVEAVVVRIFRIEAHLSETTKAAVAQAGLERHGYVALHRLMIRDTPGYATIGELARSSRVSPATMTNRIDWLERAGLVRRVRSEEDRRRVDVEVTQEGYDRWLQATLLRGSAERALFDDIPRADRRRLADLLRRLVLAFEGPGDEPG